MNLRIWAPAAQAVDIVCGTARHPMAAAGAGHWELDVDAATLEDGYGVSLDGAPAIPDPRSRWQPDGVHGLSHVVTPERLGRAAAGGPDARPAGFRAPGLADAVIYELHVGTFTPEGTYRSAMEKLRHLVQLGVTHVEVMPVATFPGDRGWGYDGVHLYAPVAAYGPPEDLAAFVAACHAHGLAALLDVVYNHLGPDGNYLPKFAPYFTDRVKTPWGDALNYDEAESDPVRAFVIDNALMWLRDYGFDGLRLDAVHAIYSFEAVHVLEALADAVRALAGETDRRLVLIAESDLNDPRLVRTAAQGGYGLDAHWADDFHHSVHRFFTGETSGYYADFGGLQDIAEALRQGYVYRGQYSRFRQRSHGRPPLGVTADQLVVCSQNHDQIGNRAFGERLSMLVGRPQQKAIAALTLLGPYVALLFQGEEWGAGTPFLYFTDHRDSALATAVEQGRRREFAAFGWQDEIPNPQALHTFEQSKLDWTEVNRPENADMLAWYGQLIAVRRQRGRDAGQTEVSVDPAAGWLCLRHAGVLALFNFADHEQPVPMPEGLWRERLRSDHPAHEPCPPRTANGADLLGPAATHVYLIASGP
jgi:maltooligosyltrehalose trehalohydrolase